MVFYSDKNSRCKHNADHRRQIESAEIKSAKKQIRKKRRSLDSKVCLSDNEDENYKEDNCKITYKIKHENGIYKNYRRIKNGNDIRCYYVLWCRF
jgi:hypothetical protein